MNKKILLLSLLLGFFLPIVSHAQCSPFMGVGNVQFLDNTAKPLQSGVLYVFQAGTSTQQATFTSSSCGTVNTNPITFGTGARASIWLTTSALYKFVLCAQNDGPACSAGDILFSVDQVPGGSSGGGSGGGSPFIGVFITGASNPATSGAIRLATGDLQCFRNAANSGNLCWSKDSSDLLSWQGGSFKLPEVSTPTPVVGFDILEADINSHRLEQCSNGVACAQLVNAGVDVNNSDQVTGLHFGSTSTPLSTSSPSTGQFLQWDGAHIVGSNASTESVWSYGYAGLSVNNGTTACGSLFALCQRNTFVISHTAIRFMYELIVAPVGCSVQPVIGLRDITSSTNIATLSIANGATLQLVDSGPLTGAMTAGDTFGFGVISAGTGCSTPASIQNLILTYK